MEKLKFKTVGQFLVALEEGPLYSQDSSRFTFDNSWCEVVVVNTNFDRSLPVVKYSDMRALSKQIKAEEFTRQKPIPDKALVWCWDNTDIAYRPVRFYNAKDECVFHIHGYRDGASYDHYEVIEPNSEGIYEAPFEWANEAKKKLED